MLQEKGMLVFLSISQWTARKHDKSVDNDVAAKYNTANDVGRYNKLLVAQDELRAIQRAVNKARTFHYYNTLPWSDNGDRVLTSLNYFDYVKGMRGCKDEFVNPVDSFCVIYSALVTQQKKRLNGLFNPADYPPSELIKSKFRFETTFNPLPEKGDFRVSLQDDEVEKIKEEMTQREHILTEKAMRECWQRLYDVVQHMASTLKDKNSKFKDSLVGNIVRLTQLLPKLNLTGDPDLEIMRREVEQTLASYDADDLRSISRVRRSAAKDADAILEKMAGYVGQ